MESKGSDLAKDVAKALRKEGVYRAYVMKASAIYAMHLPSWRFH